MKNKRIIKFISILLAAIILFTSLSISAFATSESNPEDVYVEDDVMNCGPPVWIIPIIIAIAPLSFCFDMFNSFMTGDFTILNEIPELFTDLWSMVFG